MRVILGSHEVTAVDARLPLSEPTPLVAVASSTRLLGGRASVFADGLLPFAAGAFLYVAAADLIPELHRAPRKATALIQLACMLLGVLVVLAPQLLGGQRH